MLESLHNVGCVSGSMQLDRQMLVDNAAVKAIIVTPLYNLVEADNNHDEVEADNNDEVYSIFTDIATLNNQNQSESVGQLL